MSNLSFKINIRLLDFPSIQVECPTFVSKEIKGNQANKLSPQMPDLSFKEIHNLLLPEDLRTLSLLVRQLHFSLLLKRVDVGSLLFLL
jgi:hypothetical protein